MGKANTQEHAIMNRHVHNEQYYRCYVFKTSTLVLQYAFDS